MASKQQTKLIHQWQSKGYYVINLVKVTPSGLPDLIACKPDKVVFIESKEHNDRLSTLQRVKLSMLTKLGFECYVNNDLFVK